MAGNNPIGFSDLFNFNDRSDITAAIKDIRALKAVYKEFLQEALNGNLAQMNAQQKELSKSIRDVATATKSLQTTNQANQATLEKNLAVIQQLREENKKLREAKKGVKDTEEAVAGSVAALTKQLAEQVKEWRKVSASQDPKKFAETSAAIAKTRAEIKSLTESTKAVTQVNKAAVGSYNELDQRTKALVVSLKAMQGGMSNTSKEAQRLKKEIADNTTQLKKFDSEMNQNFRNVGNYKSALGGISTTLSSLGIATLTLTGLFAGLMKIVDDAERFKGLEAGIRASSGSVDEFNATMAFLNSTADKYGQNLEVLAGTFKGLQAAARGTSLEGVNTRKIFESIIQAGTAMRLTTDQVQGSLLAVQQMMSKGTVSAEELRGQLGERLPGAFNLFAKAAGVSTRELGEMLKKGEVLSTEILPKFAAILEETYGGQALNNAKSLTAETNRLANAWLRFTSAFDEGTKVGNFVSAVKSGISAMLDSITGFINNPSVQSYFGMFTGRNIREAAAERRKEGEISDFRNMSATDRRTVLNNKRQLTLNARTDSQQQFRPEDRAKARQDFYVLRQDYSDYLKADRELKAQEAAQAAAHAKEMNDINGAKAEKGAKSRQRELDDAIRAQDAMIRANAEYQIALAEQAFEEGPRKVEDERKLEDKRLSILKASYKQRLALYSSESKEAANIRTDEAQAVAAHAKAVADIRKKEIDQIEKLIEAQQKLQIAEAERVFNTTNRGTVAEIEFEATKLAIIKAAFDQRIALYEKDSQEYANLKAEQVNAETNAQARIKALQERQRDARQGAEGAERSLQSTTNIARNRVAVAQGRMTPQAAEEEAYAERIAGIQAEIGQRTLLLQKMKEGDVDYYNTQKEITELRKTLVTEEADHTISESERVKEKRIALQQAVLDFTVEAANTAFEIGRDINEARQQDLEREKEQALEAAGSNAAARARIEENFARKQFELRRKQAIYDKAQALFNIGVNTAVGVSAALANPLTLPFVVPFIISMGALQAAAVIAKPLPRYAVGRGKGKAEFAEVNEEGFELIERNGSFRVAGGGKNAVTFLHQEDVVHTHKRSKEILDEVADRHQTERYIDSLLEGTGVVRAVEKERFENMTKAITSGMVSEEGLERVFSSVMSRLPLNSFTFDAKGFRQYENTKAGRIENLNNRNSMFGNG